LTQVSDRVNIEDMTIEERTDAYIQRRLTEMRGESVVTPIDERTEIYISQRLAQLRGKVSTKKVFQEHPYIKRRLAELRKKRNEAKTY
jgi:hypothetical protein